MRQKYDNSAVGLVSERFVTSNLEKSFFILNLKVSEQEPDPDPDSDPQWSKSYKVPSCIDIATASDFSTEKEKL